MFTGIVQARCSIVRVAELPGLRQVSIDLGDHAQNLKLGASVAINGVCLTVCKRDEQVATFDIIDETLTRTNLGELVNGALVNVERSITAGDEIGGHRVSGHVYDTARIARIDTAPNVRTLWLAVAPRWIRYLPYKGFVAVDGASLTIAEVDPESAQFAVSLIPETIARTSLGTAPVGTRVNLEIDTQTQAVVDTVERMLTAPEWRARLRELLTN